MSTYAAEVKQFTADPGANIITLDNTSLNVKKVSVIVIKNSTNIGYGSGSADVNANNRGVSNLDSVAPSAVHCAMADKLVMGTPTAAVRGKIISGGLSTVGEMEFYFDNAEAGYTVQYCAEGIV